MVKFCPVLLTYDFCWPEGNQYTVKPMAVFSLVLGIEVPTPWSEEDLDLVAETLWISITSWQLLSSGIFQAVFFICSPFPGYSHIPQLYLSGSCWYRPGCPHHHVHQKARPEGRDEQQPAKGQRSLWLLLSLGSTGNQYQGRLPCLLPRELILLYTQLSCSPAVWQPWASATPISHP